MADDILLGTDDSSTVYLYTWLTGNLHRTYPVAEHCNMTSTAATGSFLLPQSLLIDMSVMHAPMAATGRFFISNVTVDGNGIRIRMSFQPDASGEAPILFAESPYISAALQTTTDIAAIRSSHTFTFSPVALGAGVDEAYAPLEGCIVTAVVGTGSGMQLQGSFDFTAEATEIEASRVMSTITGIQYISFYNGSERLVTLTDGFAVKAGDGISFSYQVVSGVPEITVSRVLTEEETASVRTAAEAADAIQAILGTPIRTINGIAPDASGAFTISGLDCTSVEGTTNGLAISNPCAKPCCDTGTPEDITAALTSLNDAKERLMTYYEALTQNIQSMQARLASLIASRS